MQSSVRSPSSLLLAGGLALGVLSSTACDPADSGVEERDLVVADSEGEVVVEAVMVDGELVPPPPVDGPAADRPDFDLTAAPDAQAWTGSWISEEDAATTCPKGQLMSGADCDGSYCDNVRMYCADFGGSQSYSYWSHWVSEEAPTNMHICTGDRYVTGMTCKGSNCDRISVECTSTSLPKIDCGWTGPHSEENPPLLAWPGRAVAGIFCAGSRCDLKWYWTCQT